jgi:hypothetical protein
VRKDRGPSLLRIAAALLVLLLCGCAEEGPPPKSTADPLPRSIKEYELYSWKSGTTWYFTLITGTNRLKTRDEITAPENVEEGEWVKITAAGVPELKSVLARLPSGTQVFWHTARHLDSGSLRSEPKLRRPPVWMVSEVRSACTEQGLDLAIGR